MQLKQLRYFVHVAELGSFSKAAVHLRIAQPALSKQVQLLEQELGVSLLNRDGRGARVTPAGADLLTRSVRLFRDLAEMRDAVIMYANVVSGNVTIAVPPSVGVVLIPQVLMTCRATYPSLEIKVLESSNMSILEEWLVSGRVDIAVLNSAAQLSKNLNRARLFSEPLYLIGRGKDMKGFGDAIPLTRLAELDLILPHPAHGIRMMVDAASNARGVDISPRYEVDSVAIMKQLAIMGAGLAVLPRSVVRDEVADGRLAMSQIVDPRLIRELLFTTATERPLTSAGKKVESILRQHASDLDTADAPEPYAP